MQRGILAIQTEPVPGHEDEFNAWYDTTHVPEILATEGFLLGRRFRAVPSLADPGAASGFSKYLALYDIASADLRGSYQALLDRYRSGVMSPDTFVQKDPPYRSQLFEEILRRR
jgi:hypothetical protein